MARASLRGLEKRYGEVAALERFDLEIEDGELVAVVGPSGCGKSTLLRLIAGLDEATAGEIRLDGVRIDDRPPADRDVAMVFQSYALYPHMTVRGNVEFPLRMRGVAPAERRRRVAEAADLLELVPLLERRPAELSGGQRQRVALARALVRRPRLFLLDEPLSNLDARLRTSVRRSIREIQRRLAVTTLYVTHDQTEAMTLGDRIAVLNRGRLEQVGAPLELYERPATTFVAGFLGSPPMNLLRGRVVAGALEVGGERVALGGAAGATLAGLEREVTVGVRPEAFAALGGAAAREEAMLVARLEPGSAERLGSETVCAARIGSETLAVRLLGAAADLPERVGAPFAALHLFDRQGRRIEASSVGRGGGER